MSPQDLAEQAQAVLDAGGRNLSLILWRGFPRPQGMPRGELLIARGDSRIYSFDARRILTWVRPLCEAGDVADE
jgi:hypothetical protein